MGKAQAATIARELVAAGLAADTPVLLVENASLAGERRFATRLDLLPIAARTALGSGPALVLIGEAVRAESAARSEARALTSPW
jgi:uroporphyrin-III C-methyltransferase